MTLSEQTPQRPEMEPAQDEGIEISLSYMKNGEPLDGLQQHDKI